MSMKPRLNDRTMKQIERRYEVDDRLLEILGLVVSEWSTDPMSVQCFDLRIVEEAKALWEERKRLPRPF